MLVLKRMIQAVVYTSVFYLIITLWLAYMTNLFAFSTK